MKEQLFADNSLYFLIISIIAFIFFYLQILVNAQKDNSKKIKKLLFIPFYFYFYLTAKIKKHNNKLILIGITISLLLILFFGYEYINHITEQKEAIPH
ncbi:MAG: hypothetical protein FXF47_06125 [Candidatus Mcinerneyibacterium aminivorans]|jgi:hypothetical protein|uniref:Uncharacterized protein n=1 Tax=Candidatus Mcinerneyibacterium aminivorans TaxID=2703815 RepID=A0A5D0MIC3_9BACT|nr:MAG: hypothetical protein FXF47_06125 [Candidatus Mcinerneyibacterium aminivorans]